MAYIRPLKSYFSGDAPASSSDPDSVICLWAFGSRLWVLRGHSVAIPHAFRQRAVSLSASNMIRTPVPSSAAGTRSASLCIEATISAGTSIG